MMYDLKHKLDCQQIIRLKRGNDVFTARHSKDLNRYILERNGETLCHVITYRSFKRHWDMYVGNINYSNS